jgi:hypothetical protein
MRFPLHWTGMSPHVAGMFFMPEADLNDPDVKAQVDKIVSEAVTGLKANNEKLISERRADAAKVKEIEDRLKAFDGIDPVKTRELLDAMDKNVELKLIKDGKIEEVINGRVERLRKDHETQLNGVTEKLTEAEKREAAYKAQIFDLTVGSGVAAAAAGKVNADATPLVQMLARDVFRMGEDGKIEPRNKDGALLYGKDGKTPLSYAEWIDSLVDTHPSLFPAKTGGGARGNGRAADGKKEITRADFDRLDPATKSKRMSDGFVVIDG